MAELSRLALAPDVLVLPSNGQDGAVPVGNGGLGSLIGERKKITSRVPAIFAYGDADFATNSRGVAPTPNRRVSKLGWIDRMCGFESGTDLLFFSFSRRLIASQDHQPTNPPSPSRSKTGLA